MESTFENQEKRGGIISAHASSQLNWPVGLSPPKIIPCRDLSLGTKAMTTQPRSAPTSRDNSQALTIKSSAEVDPHLLTYLSMVILKTQMQSNKLKLQSLLSSTFKCSCHEPEATCWSLSSRPIAESPYLPEGTAPLLLGFPAILKLGKEIPQPKQAIEPASSKAEDLLLHASALCESSTGRCAALGPWCLPDLAPSGGSSPQIRLMPSSPSMQSPRSRATSEGWIERAGLRRAKPASVRGLPWRLYR